MRLIGATLMTAVVAIAQLPLAGFAAAADSEPGVMDDGRLQSADQLIAQGNVARRDKKPAQALLLYEKALAMKEAALGADHATLAPVLEALGALHKELGQPGQALTYLQRALEINERNLGENNPRVAVNLNDIAALHQAAGRYPVALPLYQRALAILEQALGAEHPNVGATLNNLAGLYRDAGEPARALPLLQRSVGVLEKTYGAEHINVAGTLNNLGGVLRALGRFPEALLQYQRSLAIYEKTLGNDHTAVAAALNNLAVLHRAMANYAPALPLYQRSLAIYQKAYGPSHPVVATSLNNLALLYLNTGDYEQALALYQRSLAISEKALGPDHRDVAGGLNNLADLYRITGKFALALPVYERSLAIREKALGPNHPDVANSLNNLAELYRATGEYAKSLPLHERGLAIHEKTGGPEHPMAAASLNNIALIYWRMGEYSQALTRFQRSLEIREKTLGAEHLGVANSLNSIALMYRHAGDYARALPLYLRSLAINEKMQGPEDQSTATTLGSLAELYRDMGDAARALPVATRSLAIREKAFGPIHPDVALSLLNLARLHWSTGGHAQALPLLQRALSIAGQTDAPETLWRIQDALRIIHAQRGQLELAIFFGKQAVNTIQGLRARLTGLDQELQRGFLTDKTGVYRDLADLLIRQGRLAEAQHVLGMLKEEEFFDFLRRSESNETRQRRIAFQPHEQPWHDRLTTLTARMVKSAAERADLERRSKLGVTDVEKTRLAELNREIEMLGAELQRYYREVTDAFASAKSQGESAPDAVTQLKATQQTLSKLGAGSVLVQYVLSETRINIILTTAATQIARSVDVPQKDLNQKIDFFRVALRNPAISALPMGQELYKLLLAPIEQELNSASARTLMLSLDGVLRYIPAAALHDGKRYLAERYDLALYTEVTRDNLNHRPGSDVSIAGLGLTRQIEKFDPLPEVKAELNAIVRNGNQGLIKGELHFDEQFNLVNIKQALRHKHPLMHLASHFVFRPGNESTSFLLLGDGDRLTLSRIRQENLDFTHVDLVTLSACDTGVGGGRTAQGEEVEGLGALVQKQGAKGVIATLWPVADESTGLFMQHFYRLREEKKLTKADALRQAQVLLLKGQPASGAAAPDAPFAHPYFWAPFILMGNWL
jgi:CHAT domain-containing protein/tetratricopeptide (TPR) repeat protein